MFGLRRGTGCGLKAAWRTRGALPPAPAALIHVIRTIGPNGFAKGRQLHPPRHHSAAVRAAAHLYPCTRRRGPHPQAPPSPRASLQISAFLDLQRLRAPSRLRTPPQTAARLPHADALRLVRALRAAGAADRPNSVPSTVCRTVRQATMMKHPHRITSCTAPAAAKKPPPTRWFNA